MSSKIWEEFDLYFLCLQAFHRFALIPCATIFLLTLHFLELQYSLEIHLMVCFQKLKQNSAYMHWKTGLFSQTGRLTHLCEHQFIPLGCLEFHNVQDKVQHKVKPRILAATRESFLHLNFLPLFCLLDNGVFSLQLSVQADIAPVAQVLVYTTVPSKEVIADSAKFYTELCFNNKVSVHFLREQPSDCSVVKLLFRFSLAELISLDALTLDKQCINCCRQLHCLLVCASLEEFN